MIAVDSNILVYSHRTDSPWYLSARAALYRLAEQRAPWAIPWPSIHEFVAVVTHPRIYNPPTPVEAAVDQVAAWIETPNLVLLSEPADYWAELSALLISARVAGPLVHDARIAALCSVHGVRELWTADRDFSRFPGLRVSNPLVAPM